MVEPTPDPDHQLEELCRVLNYFNVGYIVFGSHVARLNGVPLETIDVDVVPAPQPENLQRLVEALNLLGPRWRVEGVPGGMKIDGGLDVRHFVGDSAAIGLLTRLGPIDIVLAPRGFEQGYVALVGRSKGDAHWRPGSPRRRLGRPRPIQGAAAAGQRPRAPRGSVPSAPRTVGRV